MPRFTEPADSTYWVPHVVDLAVKVEDIPRYAANATFSAICNNGLDISPVDAVQKLYGHETEMEWTIDFGRLINCAGRSVKLVASFGGTISTERTVNITSYAIPITYITISTVSLLCSILIFVCYYLSPRLQEWPGPLMIRKTFHTFLLTLLILGASISNISKHPAEKFCPPFLSFAMQWTLIGIIGWYTAIINNALSAALNPFRAPQRWLIWYSLLTTLMSAISATLVVALNLNGYRLSEEVCWIRDSKFPNYASFFLLFVPVGVSLLFGIGVILYALHRLYMNPKMSSIMITSEARQEAVRKLAMLVSFCTVYWAISGGALFEIFIQDTQDETEIVQNRSLPFFFAVMFSGNGFWDALTWTITQRRNLWLLIFEGEFKLPMKIVKNKMKENKKDIGDLSLPLRKEFIQQTTRGIKTHLRYTIKGVLKPKPFLRQDGVHHGYMAMEGGSVMTDEEGNTVTAQSDDGKDHFFDLSVVRSRANSLSHSLFANYSELSESKEDDCKTNDIEFCAYNWRTFQQLRKAWGIKDDQLLESLSGSTEEMIKKFSEGASGSFFFFTKDSKYLVKTMSATELGVLRRILPAYLDFMETNPRSLIVRFLGVFSLTLFNHTEYFSLMTNVLYVDEGYKIHLKFDLKGSRVNRTAKKKKNGKVGTLKDNDFRVPMELSTTKRNEVLRQLGKDSEFLMSQYIMDYSLIVGVHTDTFIPVEEKDYLPTVSATGGEYEIIQAARLKAPGAYHIGIIDVLQEWDFVKIAERWLKILFKCHCKDRNDLSCVPPLLYQQRFMKYMSESVMYDYKALFENKDSRTRKSLKAFRSTSRTHASLEEKKKSDKELSERKVAEAKGEPEKKQNVEVIEIKGEPEKNQNKEEVIEVKAPK